MISVVIPCYNAGKYLGEALGSVLSQTRPVDEIIVVDDCSIDNSLKIASGYPVKILQTPRNSGGAVARNLGVAAVQGDVIAWIDADDFWEPNHCEVVVGLLDKYPEADVAFSSVRFIGAPGNWPAEFFDYCSRPSDVFWNCLRYCIVPAMAAVTRTKAIRSVGCYDPGIRISEDFDLWLRLSRRSLFVGTRQITANYRQHDGQISSFPNRQTQSLYESRLRMLRTLRTEGNHVLAQQVGEQILKIWIEELAWVSRQGNADLFRFFWSLRRSLPDRNEAGTWNLFRCYVKAVLLYQRFCFRRLRSFLRG